jgi:hypothetical protein
MAELGGLLSVAELGAFVAIMDANSDGRISVGCRGPPAGHLTTCGCPSYLINPPAPSPADPAHPTHAPARPAHHLLAQYPEFISSLKMQVPTFPDTRSTSDSPRATQTPLRRSLDAPPPAAAIAAPWAQQKPAAAGPLAAAAEAVAKLDGQLPHLSLLGGRGGQR